MLILQVLKAAKINIEKSVKFSIIVAKLENMEMNNQLIRVSKTKKLNANMLVNNWPIENKIFINERLTKDKRILFTQT